MSSNSSYNKENPIQRSSPTKTIEKSIQLTLNNTKIMFNIIKQLCPEDCDKTILFSLGDQINEFEIVFNDFLNPYCDICSNGSRRNGSRRNRSRRNRSRRNRSREVKSEINQGVQKSTLEETDAPIIEGNLPISLNVKKEESKLPSDQEKLETE